MKPVYVMLCLLAGLYCTVSAVKECPAVEAGMVGICVESCSNDEECGDGHRCCSNGCGHTCKDLRCPIGVPALNTTTSVELFCGRGIGRTPCSDGYYCEIHPADAYAVCCECTKDTCPDPDPCQDMMCGSDEICVLSEVQCIKAPCPPMATCKKCTKDTCPDPDPCQDMMCGSDEICVLSEVQCIKAPCPPMATCKKCTKDTCPDPDPCQDMMCGSDEICVLSEVQCIKAPCPPMPTCKKCTGELCPSDPCKNIECEGDQICVSSKVQCIRAPCPPIATCIDKRCHLPKEVGPCEAAMDRHYYNTNYLNCILFQYGGCDGNANNFETKEECELICAEQSYDKISDSASSSLLVGRALPLLLLTHLMLALMLQ